MGGYHVGVLIPAGVFYLIYVLIGAIIVGFGYLKEYIYQFEAPLAWKVICSCTAAVLILGYFAICGHADSVCDLNIDPYESPSTDSHGDLDPTYNEDLDPAYYEGLSQDTKSE